MVAPFDVSDHYTQFIFGSGGPQVQNTLLNAIWLAIVWEIWKKINNRILNVKDHSIMHIVDKIKSISFSWLKEKFVRFSFNYHGWWLSRLAMLATNSCYFFRISLFAVLSPVCNYCPDFFVFSLHTLW